MLLLVRDLIILEFFLPQIVLIQFHIWTWLLVVCHENSLSSFEVY